MKKLSTVTLWIGAVLMLGGLIPPRILQSQAGAEGVYAYFYYLLSGGGFLWLLLLGLTLAVTGLLCRFRGAAWSRVCSRKTAGLAIGASAALGLGLGFLLIWGTASEFAREITVLARPLGIVGGAACAAALAVLAAVYARERQASPSGKGMAVDALLCLGYLPSFFFTLVIVYDWILGLV